MITYIEKGVGLHDAIRDAGHVFSFAHSPQPGLLFVQTSVGQMAVCDNEAAVQGIINTYPASSTAAPIIAEIKLHARERILARYPEWAQANMTARSVELTELIATGSTLTTAEQAELTTMKGVWAWIKSVRSKSDEHEAALAALVAAADFGGILAYNWRAGWPE